MIREHENISMYILLGMGLSQVSQTHHAGPESIVFIYIFFRFLPNKDGSGILDLGLGMNVSYLMR